jgi:hypothetical protein
MHEALAKGDPLSVKAFQEVRDLLKRMCNQLKQTMQVSLVYGFEHRPLHANFVLQTADLEPGHHSKKARHESADKPDSEKSLS